MCGAGPSIRGKKGSDAEVISGFDVHTPSGRMVLRHGLRDGSVCARMWDLARREPVAEISSWYMPQGLRFSPDGSKISFFGDGTIHVYDVATQTIRSVFDDPGLDASFSEWDPSGQSLVFCAHPRTRTRHPPDIFTLNLASGAVTRLNESADVDRFPQWSPSGNHIAFLRQSLSEPGLPKHVMIYDVRTGETEDCSPDPHASYTFGRHCWSPDADVLLALEHSNGKQKLMAIAASDRRVLVAKEVEGVSGAIWLDKAEIVIVHPNRIELMTSVPRKADVGAVLPLETPIGMNVTGPNIVPGGARDALFFRDANSSIYQWSGEAGLREIFHDSDDSHAPSYEYEQYTCRSKDARSIPVHRLTPPNPRNMALVFVFGGPGESVQPNDPMVLRLVAEGYEVLCPAYRGCDGYGAEHKDANLGEYGRADVWDAVACADDWRVRTGRQRPIAVVGFSYGGFLTFLALAAAGAPWACGVTLWGCTRIPPLHAPRAFPSDPAERQAAERERSPFEQAVNIRAPLLMLHGAQDTTATSDEVERIQRRVQSSGTRCELVVYEDDGHGLKRHREEMFAEVLRFLASCAGDGTPGPTP